MARTIAACIVVGAVAVPLGEKAGAEGISGSADLTYSRSESKSDFATGESFTAKNESFFQRYFLALTKSLYPNLRFSANGSFERNNSVSNVEPLETETHSTTTRISPYLDLALSTPLYRGEIYFRRNEDKNESSNTPPVRLVRDIYAGLFGWNPDGFPSASLQVDRIDSYDKDRLFQDTSVESLRLSSDYRPVRSLFLQYRGFLSDTNDKISQTEIRTQGQTGIVTFADQWMNQRISLNGRYNIGYRETSLAKQGTGEVVSPLSPVAGLASIDDTPLQGALDVNLALLDGDMVTIAGINLGVPPPLGDSRPRNIGLDFFTDMELNTLLVWIDRDLPAVIASSFTWNIYTSQNNLDWSLIATVSNAPFGPFENRFEIRFPNTTTRYIKAVTSPISPAVAAQAPNFQNPDRIFVTELQATIRRPAAEVQGKDSSTSQQFDLSGRVKILEKPLLFYEGAYYISSSDTGPSTSRISNGLSAAHPFSRVLSGSARIAREDGKEVRGDRVSYTYSASLAAVPIPAWTSTLVFSGNRDEFAGEKSSNNSISLYNTAHLYQGVDVNLGAGEGFSTSGTGQKGRTIFLNSSVGITPNKWLNIGLLWDYSSSRQSGGNQPDSSNVSRNAQVDVQFYPLRAVYLAGTYRVEWKEAGKKNTLTAYSLNWAPLPDGTLLFNLGASETSRSQDESRDRAISPNVRWNISPRAFLNFAYQWSQHEDLFQKSLSTQLSSGLRITF